MDGVEPVRSAEEVRGALAGTADARQLDHVFGVDPHLVERVDDALGDGIVPTPGAERRLAAAIRCDFESDSVRLGWRWHGGSLILRRSSRKTRL